MKLLPVKATPDSNRDCRQMGHLTIEVWGSTWHLSDLDADTYLFSQWGRDQWMNLFALLSLAEQEVFSGCWFGTRHCKEFLFIESSFPTCLVGF